MTQIEAANKGMIVPMSTMPGARPCPTYAARMATETIRFCGGATPDRPALIKRGQTRLIGDSWDAAKTPVRTNEPATFRFADKRPGLGAN
jgi:hypothetical protein